MTATPHRTAHRFHRSPSRRAEGGFSLIELTVTMAVLLVVTTITFGMIVGIQQQNNNVQATINGVRQSQLASTALVQYLRAAVQIAGSPPVVVVNGGGKPTQEVNSPPSTANATDTSLGVVTYSGNPSNGAAPALVPVYVTFTPGSGSQQRLGTGQLSVIFGYGSKTQTVKTFAVFDPAGSPPLFQYLEYTAPPYGPGNPQGSLQALSKSAMTQATCLANVVAIGLDISFLAGPAALPTRGYAADVATTLNTTIFLHNATDYGVSPTTTTLVGGAHCYS